MMFSGKLPCLSGESNFQYDHKADILKRVFGSHKREDVFGVIVKPKGYFPCN